MANTRINSCKSCGFKVTETFVPEEVMEYSLLGLRRKLVAEPAKWESVLVDGLCEKCKKREDLKREKEKSEKDKQEKIRKGCEIIGGEYAYRNFNFDSYKPKTESQKEALKVAMAFNPARDNVMFVGPAGTGKSHLACAIALQSEENLNKTKRWRITELLRDFRRIEAYEEANKINAIVNCKLLIIEDFGAHKETDWSTSILWEILDRRIETGTNGLIMTTNIGRGKMAEEMGERIPSRLSALCKIVKIDGPDGRIKDEK